MGRYDFGDLTLIESDTLTYSSDVAAANFTMSREFDVLILGVAAGGASGKKGETNIVSSLLDKGSGVERILGNTAAGTPQNGVPLRHIAATGDNEYPRWHGDALLLQAMLADYAAKACGGKDWRAKFDAARERLRRLFKTGHLALAGFVNHGFDIRMTLTALASGDEPSNLTLLGMILGDKGALGNKWDGVNEPWWFAHTAQAHATTAAPVVDFSGVLDFPSERVRGRMLHLQLLADLYAQSGGALQANAHHLLSLGPREGANNIGSSFINRSAPLSAFADPLTRPDFPIFEREVSHRTTLGYTGSKGTLSAAAYGFYTDYLLSVRREPSPLDAGTA